MPIWITNATDERLAIYAAILASLVALAIPVIRAWVRWLYRPNLVLDFENRPRWRRVSRIAGTALDGLFFRVRVVNRGWSTAQGVRGRLVELLDGEGCQVEPFDPVDLHWAGTSFGAGRGSLELLPGQEEYLDVISVLPDCTDILGANDGGFEVLVQDNTPRGVQLRHDIDRQTLRVVVAGTNSSGAGFELKLPPVGLFAGRFLSVLHRPVHPWGEGLYPWDEQPPSRPRLDGLVHGGVDAGFGKDEAVTRPPRDGWI